jgi:hypothetical protein
MLVPTYVLGLQNYFQNMNIYNSKKNKQVTDH